MPSANSSTFDIGSVCDVSASIRIDESAGFTLRNDGGVGISGGSCRAAVAIAVCTSCAAASMLRSSENCSVICAVPSALVDVIESSDAMVENCFSSGVATAVAIVSGLAPGNDALTEIVGKSTAGRSDTGNDTYASVPKNARPNVSSAVATGRRTNSCRDVHTSACLRGKIEMRAFGLSRDWPSTTTISPACTPVTIVHSLLARPTCTWRCSAIDSFTT